MDENDPIKLLNYLIKQDAIYVQVWLKAIWAKEKPVPDNFNWLGLAEAATFRAQNYSNFLSDSLDSSNLEWAKVAISVYEFLMKNFNNKSFKESLLDSEMNLRVLMILNFGAMDNDDILDVNILINYFFDNLIFSYQEALIKYNKWRSLFVENKPDHINSELNQNLQEFNLLRQIKRKLILIRRLVESHHVYPNEELSAWLLLQEQLP